MQMARCSGGTAANGISAIGIGFIGENEPEARRFILPLYMCLLNF